MKQTNEVQTLRSSLPFIYLYISRINQQMHNVFVLYVFSLFPDVFRHLPAILKGVRSDYIKLYRALTRDS
jgi:hypothetical protein